MKKPQIPILAAITCVFAAFTLGFFLGRNYNHSDVQLSIPENTAAVQPQAETSPEETDTPATETTVPATTAPLLVNINTATQAELMELPGIGEVIAQRILDYREANGTFGSPQELLNVEGIGSKRLEAILDYITVGG